jgi:hypothetical protein
MLGVSGGTYAALNALRIHFEGTLNDSHSNCKAQLEKISEKHAAGSTILIYCNRRKTIIRCTYFVWRICHVIPAVVFSIFIFFIWVGALKDWAAISASHADPASSQAWQQFFPWKYSYSFLFWLGITGFSCTGIAMLAWGVCYLSRKGLKLHHAGVVEQQDAETKKKEAEKIAPL